MGATFLTASTHKMATINTTTEFVPEIWGQIKEYAGIFPLPANIIHFDKLTFDELENSIDAWEDEVPKPFKHICIESVYDIFYNKEQFEYSGDKWFYDGGEVKEKEKKELFVKWFKKYYRDEYGLRQYTYAAIKDRKDRGLGGWVRRDDIADFWNEVSEMITYHFQKRDDKKAAAKKKRAAAKAIKETPKGMIAEINKIEDERIKLIKRIKNDQEKLNKLTTKGREWRTKLAEKRKQIRII
jgi:hypothetical protein